jgi:spore germination cell wall hydrolase CwlJ-like protein
MRYKILGTGAIMSALVLMLALILPSTRPLDISQFEYQDLVPAARKQVDCMAENIYFEAAHEPLAGKIGVAMVTLNRVHSGAYPSTICAVVQQKTRFNSVTVCQFSWFCDARVLAQRARVKHSELYRDIQKLSTQIYLDHESMDDPTQGAMFYHAVYIPDPGWGLPVTVRIGQHIFYRPRLPRGEKT